MVAKPHTLARQRALDERRLAVDARHAARIVRERFDVRVDARFDGQDYPVTGTPLADTVAYRRPDSRTLKGIVKKAGNVVLLETAVVSRDGKTLTGTYSSPDGKPVGVAVFDKQ